MEPGGITILTRAHPYSETKKIWLSPSHPVTLRSNLYPIWAYIFGANPPFRYSNQNLVLTCLLSQSCHNSHPFDRLWLKHPNNIWQAGVLNLFTIHFSEASFSQPDVFLSTLLWNTFSLCFPLTQDQVHTRIFTHMNVTTLRIDFFFGLL